MSKTGTPKAGHYTLVFGFLLAIIAFYIDFDMIAGKRYITDVWGIHFMMKAFYLFAICTVFYFAISQFTPAASKEPLDKMNMKKPLSFITEGKIDGITDPRLLAGFLVLVMITLYYVFR
jgi:SSS family solute:Na+ symporter